MIFPIQLSPSDRLKKTIVNRADDGGLYAVSLWGGVSDTWWYLPVLLHELLIELRNSVCLTFILSYMYTKIAIAY